MDELQDPISELEKKEMKKVRKNMQKHDTLCIRPDVKEIFRSMQRAHENTGEALKRIMRRAKWCYEHHVEDEGVKKVYG